MKIIKWDDSKVGNLNDADLQAYTGNKTAYSSVPFKQRRDPNNGWAVPFVTGH
jgi:hypothetical protein